MPLILFVVALLMLTAAFRKQEKLLVTTLKSEFTGSDNFLKWMFGILLVGAVGYWSPAKPVSNALLVLIALSIILAHSPKGQAGLVDKLSAAFQGD